ncbi:DegT/DnrJ/EryC1/StrS family aminotransferase [Alkaliphilus peptidifermentans]|uniref:dTDP-4-amino-4,6-dideoxygalactose transaminase n=1 Tax=Alkaliphilus peptidifermentans DSM 18978 TaxID=1120976 RepID=A0A1G5L9C7_9FIRM|nr:DegT/DnrJ/EryC1/StrS family aminotransferase [Alkaliphilus peptidifermentans]SCZ09462.1 dTDP-4-amino-4,6-dideoxygalactose transaminase [Alkaliphilus peptidifermentans DSM 18978]
MKINDKFLYRNKDDDFALKKALDNLQLSGTSSIIEEYEEKLRDFFGSKYAVAVSSGTSAIHCALYALGIREGDEVLIPPTAPIMTAIPVLQQKAIPIFVDTNKDNFGFDIQALKKSITKKAKAIICVPMWGYPFDYDELLDVCESYNISLIEDTAQAHCTTYNNKNLGTIGNIGCFSTHDRKILPTGEGGFILTNDKNQYESIKSFIQFGYMTGNIFGTNYKLSTLQATLGMSRIKKIDWQLDVRMKNAKLILDNLTNKNIKEIVYPKNSNPNYYSLVLQVNKSYNKVKNLNEDMVKNGIPTDIVRYNYQPMYKYPLFKQFEKECLNAEHLSKTIITIPVHPNINDNNIDYIVDYLNKIDFKGENIGAHSSKVM